MAEKDQAQKVLVVGAGPVGALAAVYAAERGDDVHVYELRAGKDLFLVYNIPHSIEVTQLSHSSFASRFPNLALLEK